MVTAEIRIVRGRLGINDRLGVSIRSQSRTSQPSGERTEIRAYALLRPPPALLAFPARLAVRCNCLLEHVGRREVVQLRVELALIAGPLALGKSCERRGEAAEMEWPFALEHRRGQYPLWPQGPAGRRRAKEVSRPRPFPVRRQ